MAQKEYVVDLPGGVKRAVLAPEGASQSALYRFALSAHVQEEAQRQEQRIGFFGALGQGLRQSTVDTPAAMALTLEQTPEREEALLQQAMEQRGVSWEDVKKDWRERGAATGARTLSQFARQILGGSIGALAPGVAGAKVGAAIAPPVAPFVGPLSKPIGGAVGFIAGMLPGEYNRMLQTQVVERAAQRAESETARDLAPGQAGIAALGSSALNLVPLAAVGVVNLRRGTQTAAQQSALQAMRKKLADEGVWKAIAKGVGVSAATEVPTEIAQAALERWQAGLPISFSDADARKDYEEALAGALVLAPAFGPAGALASRRRAGIEVRQAEELELAQRRVQERQERDTAERQTREQINAAEVNTAQVFEQWAATQPLDQQIQLGEQYIEGQRAARKDATGPEARVVDGAIKAAQMRLTSLRDARVDRDVASPDPAVQIPAIEQLIKDLPRRNPELKGDALKEARAPLKTQLAELKKIRKVAEDTIADVRVEEQVAGPTPMVLGAQITLDELQQNRPNLTRMRAPRRDEVINEVTALDLTTEQGRQRAFDVLDELTGRPEKWAVDVGEALIESLAQRGIDTAATPYAPQVAAPAAEPVLEPSVEAAPTTPEAAPDAVQERVAAEIPVREETEVGERVRSEDAQVEEVAEESRVAETPVEALTPLANWTPRADGNGFTTQVNGVSVNFEPTADGQRFTVRMPDRAPAVAETAEAAQLYAEVTTQPAPAIERGNWQVVPANQPLPASHADIGAGFDVAPNTPQVINTVNGAPVVLAQDTNKRWRVVTGNPQAQQVSFPSRNLAARFAERTAQADPTAATDVADGAVSNSIVNGTPPNLQPPVAKALQGITNSGAWSRLKDTVMLTSYMVDNLKRVAPRVGEWAERLMQADGRRNGLHHREMRQVDPIVASIEQMSDPDFNAAMAFMQQSTLAQEWGFAPKHDPALYNPDSPTAEAFRQLPEAAQNVVEAVFEHQYEQGQKKLQAVESAVAALEQDAQLIGQDGAAELVQSARNELEALRESLSGPYTSLQAIGEYLVVGKSAAYKRLESDIAAGVADAAAQQRLDQMKSDPDHFAVAPADSQKEAMAIEKRYRERFGDDTTPNLWHHKSDAVARALMPVEAVARLRQSLITEGKRNPEAKVTEQLIKTIDELYIRSLVDSAKKSELRRFGATDLTPNGIYRAFSSQAIADAHHIANLSMHGEMANAAQMMLSEARAVGGEAERSANEVYNRYQQSYTYEANPFLSGMMNASAHFMLLFKPAYFMYNLTQPTMYTIPRLTQHFGVADAYSTVWRNYGRVVKSLKGTDPLSFQKIDNTRGERDALTRYRDDGQIENTLMNDVPEAAARGRVRGVGARALRMANFFRNAAVRVEQLNRSVTFLSAYELALDQRLPGDQYTDLKRTAADQSTTKAQRDAAKAQLERATEEAYAEASRLTKETQIDYGSMERPSLIGKNQFRRALAQFRMFQIGQAALLIRMVNEAGFSTPEKRAAMRGLTFLLGHHAVMAGAWGMPAMSAIAFALTALGDEEPFDLELKMREFFGTDMMGDILMYGVPAGVLGVNVSQNLGMGQTFSAVPFAELSASREGYEEAIMGILGPSVSLGAQWFDAVSRVKDDDYYGAVAGLLPGALKTSMQAYRETSEGVLNRRGDTLITPEEVTMADSFFRALGFTTHRDYVRRMAQSKAVAFDRHFSERTSRLKNRYTRAFEAGDRQEMERAREEWLELQRVKGDYGFTKQPLRNLLKAPEEKRERERETIGGVQVRRGTGDIVSRVTGERQGFEQGGLVQQARDAVGRAARRGAGAAAAATDIKEIADWATNTAAQQYGSGTQWGGEGDALRHLLFHGEVSRRYGQLPSQGIGLANEYLVGIGQRHDERRMDLYNDRLGRQIGRDAADRNEVLKRALQKVEEGRAQTLQDRGEYAVGGWVPPSAR